MQHQGTQLLQSGLASAVCNGCGRVASAQATSVRESCDKERGCAYRMQCLKGTLLLLLPSGWHADPSAPRAHAGWQDVTSSRHLQVCPIHWGIWRPLSLAQIQPAALPQSCCAQLIGASFASQPNSAAGCAAVCIDSSFVVLLDGSAEAVTLGLLPSIA